MKDLHSSQRTRIQSHHIDQGSGTESLLPIGGAAAVGGPGGRHAGVREEEVDAGKPESLIPRICTDNSDLLSAFASGGSTERWIGVISGILCGTAVQRAFGMRWTRPTVLRSRSDVRSQGFTEPACAPE